MNRLAAWALRHATALYAWARQRVLALTDYALDAAMARLGEAMTWEEVRRIAEVRIEEENKTMGERLEEWDEMIEESNRIRGTVAAAGFRAWAEKIDADIMAMGGKPRLRLLKKP